MKRCILLILCYGLFNNPFAFSQTVPVAADDVNSTAEDTPVNGDVSVNDTPSIDGGNIWNLVGANGGALNGTVVMNTDGTYTYTPGDDINGSDIITYQVCDVNNDCDQATVTVTVTAVNDMPLFTAGANQTVDEDAGGQNVNAWAQGIDDGDPELTQTLTFNVSNNNPSLFSVAPAVDAISGNLVYTPAANAHGTATVTVTLTDDATAGSPALTTDEQTFTITIDPVADTPTVTPATTNEDTQTTSGLVITRSVVDGPEITHFKITNIQNGTLFQVNGTTQIINNTFITNPQGTAGLKFTPYPNSTVSGSFDVMASVSNTDAGLGGDAVTATITVNAVNDIPQLTSISTLTGGLEDSYFTIDYTALIAAADETDVDGDPLSFRIDAVISGILTKGGSPVTPGVTTIGPGESMVWTPGMNVHGVTGVCSVKAWDGLAASADPAVTITVDISAVNDVPEVSDIPNQTIAEGGTFTAISLDNFVSDVDNTDAEISWSHAGNTSLNVSINATTHVATITTPNTDWYGAETVTFTATDPLLATDSDPVTFTVTAVNDLPVIGNIPDQTIAEGGSFATINLDTYVSDIETSDADIVWTASTPTNLTVSIVDRVASVGVVNQDWNGSEAITFTAQDESLATASDAAIFNVTAVNDAPVVSDIPDQMVTEGSSFTNIDLDDYVNDVDNTDTQLTWSFSGNSSLTVSINSTTHIATIGTPNEDWYGSETITFTATDPSSAADSDPVTFTVTPVNDAPVISDIPGQTIDEGDTFSTINLDTYVNDVDNTDAQLTWSFSGNSSLTVSINPTTHVATITIPNADWYGSETVTFTVTDPSTATDSDPATFTVTAVNDAPLVGDIPSQTITEGGTFTTISLDGYVSDVDNTDAQLTWSYSGNSSLTVSINPATRVATITTPNADWYGSETVTFTATDPSLVSDSYPVTFTVTAVNDPPVVDDILGQTIAEGGTFTTISLDGYVSDVDNTDAQLTWSNSGNSSLTVSINPTTRIATITTPNADWYGSETVTFTVTDPSTATDSDPATFTVTAVNDAPVVGDIPSQTITEGGTFTTISLDGYVSDVDNTDAQLTWSYSGNSSLTVSINPATRVATITTPNADWYGSEIITFMATDPSSANGSDQVTFTVTAVNDAPVVGDIPSQTIAEGGTFTTISLDGYVNDVDNTDAQLTWSYSGNSSLTVSINPTTHVATITTPNADWYGNETITFTATDPSLATDSDPATFTVTAVNDAPVVGDIPSQTIAEGGTFTTISLDGYVNDIDNTDAQITWSFSGNTSLSVSINTSTHVATITTPNADWYGNETITFTATDPSSATDSDPVTFTVTAVNDPPVVDDIPSQTIAEGGTFTTISLNGYVNDVDNADAQLTWSYSGNSSLTVSINPTTHVATITTPNADWYGSETVTFTVTDPSSATDSDPVTFTVTAVNDPPVVDDIPSQTIAEGGTFTTISLNSYVSDVDNTDAQLTWSYSGNSSLTVSINPATRVATITTPNADWYGSETITFTATDPSLVSDSDPVTFTVTAVNDPPVVDDIPSQTIAEGGTYTTISLDGYVNDVDNTDAQLTWSNSGNSSLTVSINPTTRIATITTPNADWYGSETVTFTVTDPSTATDSDPATFTVTAVNDAPVVGDIPSQTITEGGTFTTISLDGYVSDVDNTDAQLTWSYSGNSSLTVSINPTTRIATITTPNADWYGSETVTFTVTDPSSATDSDPVTFTVTAVNDAPVVGDIPGQTIAEGGTFTTISLDGYVSDVDNTDAQLTWSYSGNSSLTVSINPATRVATITTPNADWYGVETITFRATDPSSATDDAQVIFTVTSVNDLPVVINIPNQSVDEGTPFATINLDNYVTDVETPDADIIWTTSPPINLTVSIVARIATIGVVNQDWNGSEAITFTAQDQAGATAADAVTFTVTAVNDPPVVSDISDQTIPEGGTFTTISLDACVTDVDNTDGQITWAYSGNSALTVSIVGRVATITIPNIDWYGSETITFTATDPSMASDADPAVFTVTSVNDVPVVGDIPDQSVAEGSPFATINLDSFVNDVETPDASIVWTTSTLSNLTVSIVNRVATVSVVNPEWNGSESITFYAQDQAGAVASNVASFTVTPVNDPPVVGNIANQTVAEGNNFTSINLDNFVTDVDHTDAQITWTYSGNTDLSVLINASRVATIIIPDTDWYGVETITFTATDPSSGTDSDPATFTVTPVNDMPVARSVAFNGVLTTGNTLTGSYTYYDAENDPQGTSTFRWIRADNSTGDNAMAISGATGLTYHLVAADAGRYICFEVTPVATSGNTPGTAVRSSYQGPVVNAVPEASVVGFTGILKPGNILTGSYVYSDLENDPEGSSRYQWYRADDNSGLNEAAISGATARTYTLVPADVNKYISFEVQPAAQTGSSPGVAVRSIRQGPIQNAEPVASFVSISGIMITGNLLTGNYLFSDLENDPEAVSTYRWYRANDYNGAGETVITGATSTTYRLVAADAGKFISFEVTPAASSGSSPGLPVRSTRSGPVNNAVPVAIDVIFSGTLNVGSTLSGTYTYSDPEHDPEGTSLIRWYRANDAAGTGETVITGATSLSYIISPDDQGKYLSLEVTPAALSGNTPGVAVRSSRQGPVNRFPVAGAISITGTRNVGQTLSGTFSYSDADGDIAGTHLFRWYRAIDAGGTNEVAIPGANASSYTLTSEDNGRYISFGVTPVAQTGSTPGLAVQSIRLLVNSYPVANNVTVTGQTNIGQLLTGTYTYSDADLDGQGTSTFRWYRADDAVGTNETVIAGATSTTYTLTTVDGGKYICFEVTPVALSGSTPGIAVKSARRLVNSYPVADNPVISGTRNIGQTLTATFIYSDVDGDLAGTHIYQWYRSNDAGGTGETAIPGATSSTYVLTAADQGRYISFRVTPVAMNGSTPGATVPSARQIVNSNPRAENLTINGTRNIGQTLTANFAYSDVDGDLPGTHIYRWYRSDDATGTNQTAISGAVTSTYTLVLADEGRYISFDVTPVAVSGSSPGATVMSTRQLVNSYPVASNPVVSGTRNIGQTLSALFNYYDSDGDAAGTHIYQWYRSDDASGTNQTAISGGTSSSYVLVIDDQARYISFEVTPVAVTGSSPGSKVMSPRVLINSYPTASLVSVTGLLNVGVTLSGTYAYTDIDSDAEGVSIYRWYRSNDASGAGQTVISGATTTSYVLTPEDQGRYISFEVTPVAATGSTPGTTEMSPRVGPVNSFPGASNVTVNGTLNIGQTLTCTYTYLDSDDDLQGTSTYQWYRSDNAAGLNQVLITGATASGYTLTPADQGRYISVEVTPVAQSGSTPGSQVMSPRRGPVNRYPVANNVTFTGTRTVGYTLTGSYTYSDLDGDPAGTPLYRWYRSDNAAGLNQVLIPGATSLTYLLVAADQGKYISFEVIPVAQAGSTPGLSVMSPRLGPVLNAVPYVTNVVNTGNLATGQTLVGSYTYNDLEGDAEGASVYRWYRSNDISGAGQVLISGATLSTYVLTPSDVGRFISFEVIPVASAGSTPGVAVMSPRRGPVLNVAPFLTNVTNTGTLITGQVLTGSYTYNDLEGDGEGSSIYRWYRSNDASGTGQVLISGATSTSYTLMPADVGRYISFEVTPVATTGTTPGVAVMSTRRGPVANAVPVASSVTNSGTLINGRTLTGSYIYSDLEGDDEGSSTYRWYRSDDASGTNQTLIIGAGGIMYTLNSTEIGKYISFEVIPVAESGNSPGLAVMSARRGPVLNAVPVASNVTLSGTLTVGYTLTGDYDYFDLEGDVEGTSTYRWYRSMDASGTGQILIAGATSINYTLVPADENRYISFEVVPVAQGGMSPGAAVMSVRQGPVANAVPFATNVTVTGTLIVGQTLTGNYTYNDLEGNPEGTSLYRWYRANDAAGTGQVLISGATARTYILTPADQNRFISFEVTPVASTGNSPGLPVMSSRIGPVVNAAPTVTNVSFTGNMIVGEVLTASYTYNDLEGDAEGATTFRWFRSDDIAGTNEEVISGAISRTYTVATLHVGKYIRVEVTPYALTGTSPGVPVYSPRRGPVLNAAPRALGVFVSGTLRVGYQVTGNYTYFDLDGDAEGSSIYRWYRSDNASGTNQQLISGATQRTYTLVAADDNKYISFEVVPAAQTGTTPGLAVMSERMGPVINAYPVASNVTFTGSLIVGRTLTGSYQYTDLESNPEGYSFYRWYRADDASGTGEQIISGATSITYVLTVADEDKFISFEVTPVAQSGSSPGTAVRSPRSGPVLNAVPVATNVSISGTLITGQVLTGSYTYSDIEGDDEGTSVFRWYRADNAAGLNQVQITGASALNYTLVPADVNKYIGFEVTPSAQTGSSPGLAVMSIRRGPVANAVPVASNVAFSGTLLTGQILTGNYTYSDLENDPEGASVFNWYRSNDASGTGQTQIPGATAREFTLTAAETGKYISFSVIPVAQAGNTPGLEVMTTRLGPVLNARPYVTDVSFTGTLIVGRTLTGSYTYHDLENDLQGASLFRWYRADDAAGTNQTLITGASSLTYILTVNDLNKYIRFEVVPVALSGTTPGDAVMSGLQGPVLNSVPVATGVTNTGTLMVGALLTGNYTYIDLENDPEGASQYRWYRSDNASGLNQTLITGASSTTYTLVPVDEGRYISFEVIPIAQTGSNPGLAVMSSRRGPIANSPPTAINVVVTGTFVVGGVLTGSYTYTDLEGNAEGVSTYRWYRADNSSGLNEVVITGATATSYTLTAQDDGKYLSFEVTPVAQSGASPGAPVRSSWTSSIANSPPTVTSVDFTGTLMTGQTLTGTYVFTDLEDDEEGASLFRWYRADDASGTNEVVIGGAANLTYTLTAADENRYIRFEVTPVAETGTSPGLPVQSSRKGPISNSPPVALSVNITGTFTVGRTLTASYTYYDIENNPEGSSIYRWYRANDASGTGQELISGANQLVYALTPADEGLYISFEVTPVAASGNPAGIAVMSNRLGPVANAVPVAGSVTFSGILIDGQTLTGSYVYSDPENNPEGITTFSWYRADNAAGANQVQIVSANAITYVLTPNDVGRYISFEVTPVALTGNSPGLPVSSTRQGPVANAVPVATNVNITGTPTVGQTLTGVYTYYDMENNPEGSSVYRWYRSDDMSGTNQEQISGANGITYTLIPVDEGRYISFEVVPVAQSGNSPGIAVSSSRRGPVLNALPSVSNVTVTGTITVGNQLTGNYTYYDIEGDEEGTSIYRWYRANDASGTGQVVIPGATAITYTLVAADEGRYISFEVIPVASTGRSPGLPVMSSRRGPIANAVPVASNVVITGTLTVGQPLTASYTYSDLENNLQGASIFRWYRSDNLSGGNEVLITGATALTYTLVPADENRFIRFEVTPVATSGNSPGAPATSSRYGPVANSVPYATNVTTSGVPAVGETISATYTYNDREGNQEGSSVYRWYRADNSSGLNEIQIPGANSTSYVPLATDEGRYLRFAVIPVAQSGSSPGIITYSNYTSAVQSTRPTASISGNYTICNDGTTVNLGVALTGHGPWNIVCQRDGANDVTISGIASSPYMISVSQSGTYTIRSVSDNYYTSGIPSGSAVVSYYTHPTASISGSATICNDGSTTTISVSLTGTAPWNFVYQRNGVDPVVVSGIMSSPYTFQVSASGTYSLVSVHDAHCSGTVSGSAVVDYYVHPTAAISGSASICSDGSTAPLRVDLTGTAPWTFTYQRDTQNPITYNNITATPFIINVNQAGTYRLLSVHDVHCSGTVSGSATVTLLALPTARISGNALICPDAVAQLRVDLTGNMPWSLTYLHNGASPQTINGITVTPYYLTVTNAGTYTLQAVLDRNCTGTVSGTSLVTHHLLPKATLSGVYSICEGEVAHVSLVLEGTAPWNITLLRDGVLYRSISGITNANTTIEIAETGTYTVGEVSDQYCSGTISGTATVTVHPLPEVVISGLNPIYNVTTNAVPITGSPSGGVFSGPGVITVPTNMFHPGIAGTENSPHDIVYTYTSIYGCTSSDTVEVIVAAASGDIVIEKPIYCSNDAPFTITGHNVAGVVGTFSITGNIGLENLGNNQARITPSQIVPGDHIITYAYYYGDTFKLTEGVKIEVVGPVNFVSPPPATMCKNAAWIQLKGNTPTGNYTSGTGSFSGTGVYGPTPTGYYFRPSAANDGLNNIFYTYTSSNGCSQSVSAAVTISPNSDNAFSIVDACVQPGVSTVFINRTPETPPVNQWIWDFGDPESGASNTSNLKDPTHLYTGFGERTVTLISRTSTNCYDTLVTSIQVKEKPVTRFIWQSDCHDVSVPIEFVNLTTSEVPVQTSIWRVRNDAGALLSTLTVDHLSYNFPAEGEYSIELLSQSENGCTDTLTRDLIVNPMIEILNDDYFDDFEGAATRWYKGGSPLGNNSWSLDEPAGTVLNHAYSGTKAWITNPAGDYSNGENSWVTGPCFSFAGVSRPMIKAQIWPFIDDPDDGATLEYTSDGGNSWNTVGMSADESAINWFNTSDIIQAGEGWNGNTALGYLDARHDLDNLAGQKNIRFRIRFLSDDALTSEGFAFDNIWVGKRTRHVMLEHYTNITESSCAAADNYVNAWADKDTAGTVVIHYHTAFPGFDPMNGFYPGGPSARSVYYGISQVPYTRMDGIAGYQGFDGSNQYLLDTRAVIRRSLLDPPVEISLDAEVTATGALTVDIHLETQSQLNNGHQFVLHVLVAENGVQENGNTYRRVLRRMLPEEAGTMLDDLITNGSKDLTLNWNFSQVDIDIHKLDVIAFIQDENTKEILQSQVLRNVPLANSVSRMGAGNKLDFVIYPNPAVHHVTIEFEEALETETTLQVFNEHGQVIEILRLQEGEYMLTRPLERYVKGIYFVRLIQGVEVVGYGRFVVIN